LEIRETKKPLKKGKMKMIRYCLTHVCLIILTIVNCSAQSLSAVEVVKRSDEKFNGEKSGYMVMSMTIIRPSWQRTVEFKNWTLGRDYALTLITAPAKEGGQTFLKRSTEMWNWNPSINRLIKLPPSMMSQGWMGSDYTNDDIMKESSVVNDYTHQFAGEENIGGRECYRIKMVSKEDAAVLWGSQIRWIDKNDLLLMKAELYDEDGELVRTETGSDIRVMDGRTIQTKIELQPAGEPGNKTVVVIREIKFNIPLQESFFSQQNMKVVR
jgi:outer membrane lipoprotein-sorting protein